MLVSDIAVFVLKRDVKFQLPWLHAEIKVFETRATAVDRPS